MDVTPSALHLCAGPQKLHLSCPEDTTQPAGACTVALCVHVSVAKQRRLDLIDELQLRGSTVFCTSTPGICQAQQRACQHPCPSKDTGCFATADKKPARRRDVHRHQQNQPCTATTVDDEGRQSREHNAGCNITSKPALHMPLPNKTTSIMGMSTTEGNTA